MALAVQVSAPRGAQCPHRQGVPLAFRYSKHVSEALPPPHSPNSLSRLVLPVLGARM